MLTHLSLFSGIGGLDIAAEWAGFETVGQCEWEDYPTSILEKHWPGVPKWRDIRTLTTESFYEKTGRTIIDVISGGFPCQPFSVAGKQKGKGDDRYLWPEMLRVISEISPRWVLGENVPGILRIAACDVVKDLERIGYDVAVLDFEAASVGAPHRRERIAFVGCRRTETLENAFSGESYCKQQRRAVLSRTSEIVAHTDSNRLEKPHMFPSEDIAKSSRVISDTGDWSGAVRRNREIPAAEEAGSARGNHGNRTKADVPGKRWPAEPRVGRVADGVPSRVDRIRCLGNAVVPQQFYPIFRAIALEEVGNAEL